MRFDTRYSGKNVVVTLLVFSGIIVYLALIASQFFAAQLSANSSVRSLKWAIHLDPLNAEYRNRMGRFELLGRQAPDNALSWLRQATVLNPASATYWLDRATAEQLLGDFDAGRLSLTRTISADPHSSAVAWEVANRYLALGAPDDALRQYRRVMENDLFRTPAAVQICWRVRPDVDALLQNIVPSNADQAFLNFLISKNQSEASAKVWERIALLQKPVPRPFLFDYLHHLLANGEALQAAHVWQQAASLSGLEAYEPSEHNLLVNGDFSLEVLNGGFDWTYHKVPGVSLALDPINGYSGARSLRIFFEGPGIADAGISQIVSVEPDAQYEFSAYYKAEEMDGAGGPRFAVQDSYKGSTLFMSANLQNIESWTQVNGTFITGQDTHLVNLQIARVPADSPIRGKLWVDNLKVVAAGNIASLAKEDR